MAGKSYARRLELNRESYRRHREERKAAAAAWRAENPEKVRKISARYYRKKRAEILKRNRLWWARNAKAYNAARRERYAVTRSQRKG